MNRIAAVLALATAALAGARGLAFAHGPDAIFDPLTMDHHTPVSTLNVDIAYVVYDVDVPPNGDITAMGFAVAGQYVSPGGLGGYLSLPISYINVENIFPFVDESELALGNLELGGLWAKYLDDNAAIVLHAGIALPTAGNESVAELQTLASSPRWGDLVQRAPESAWFRFGVSPMGRSGILFWRADVGFDLAFDENAPVFRYSPVFRVNVGGGLDLRSTHLQVEFVTNIIDIDDGVNGDRVASTLALGARFLSGNLRPGIGLLLPVDHTAQIYDPEFAITASLAARL